MGHSRRYFSTTSSRGLSNRSKSAELKKILQTTKATSLSSSLTSSPRLLVESQTWYWMHRLDRQAGALKGPQTFQRAAHKDLIKVLPRRRKHPRWAACIQCIQILNQRNDLDSIEMRIGIILNSWSKNKTAIFVRVLLIAVQMLFSIIFFQGL